MSGTSPAFFKIPVTTALLQCIELEIFPHTPTGVIGHVPDVLRPNRRFNSNEGMIPLDNRRVILECFEAFKKFVLI